MVFYEDPVFIVVVMVAVSVFLVFMVLGFDKAKYTILRIPYGVGFFTVKDKDGYRQISKKTFDIRHDSFTHKGSAYTPDLERCIRDKKGNYMQFWNYNDPIPLAVARAGEDRKYAKSGKILKQVIENKIVSGLLSHKTETLLLVIVVISILANVVLAGALTYYISGAPTFNGTITPPPVTPEPTPPLPVTP